MKFQTNYFGEVDVVEICLEYLTGPENDKWLKRFALTLTAESAKVSGAYIRQPDIVARG